MKKIFVYLLLLFFGNVANAQQYTGTVSDTSSKAPVKNAVVLLLQPGDSLLIKFTRTDAQGHFKLDVPVKDYILMVQHPSFADYVDNITSANLSLGQVAVTPKSKLLEGIIVKSGTPIRIKGDTTIYTADSFKVSANANVEELLKKLPGIQVDKNGQIKAMGQTVEKVLVDGEEFFGDDPGMAVKNLRADAVKEVQVFDKKSDQAEFTGIDDGNTQKTINLKLKEDKKKGYFGKISLSGGLQNKIDDRYNNNLMYSSFKGKRKISGFILTGNTGQDGLNWQDNEKFGGESDNYSMNFDEDAGIMYSWKGGGSDDEPYINTQNGFIRNVNAGFQYSNKWKENTFNFSPKFNSQVYDNNQYNIRQTFFGDSSLNYNSNTVSHINRYNFKSSGIYDVKIDSFNTLKLTLRANFYHTENSSVIASETSGKSGSLINTSNTNSNSVFDKTSLSGNILFKHKFKKARRTLSFSADWKNLINKGDKYDQADNTVYNGGAGNLDFDQFAKIDKSTQTITAKAVYTEPINKFYSVELSHELIFNGGKNNQTTYFYSPASAKYDIYIDSLSNNFNQKITVNKPSLKLNYNKKKIKFNIGSGFGLTHFSLEDVTFAKTYTRNFTNFFPTASFNYSKKSNQNLRINYNGNTTQPTLNQLQPLRNNADIFNQYIGNPNLKPSFNHTFSISQNSYDFLKERWIYGSVNFRTTSNAITNNRIINPTTGKTITQPINTKGNYSFNLWTGMGFKMKKINTRININPNANYSRTADVINGINNFSKNLSAGLDFSLQKSKDKKYDFSISEDFNYNSNKNSQGNQSNSFTSNTISFEAKIYIKKVWALSTDGNYFSRQKITDADKALNNTLWNARLERTFKKDEFTFFTEIRDILNENVGITRNYYSNIYTEERNDRLRRYWMVGFAWNFKNKGSQPK